MARVTNLKPATRNEIVNNNNQSLKLNLIPSGYPSYEKFKGYEFEEFDKPINSESKKVEQLVNNQ